ncbi:hypothetical protein [Anaerobacillus alkalilacustris]|nr:hypothetical protein [Anaerobacillus alkalilacustris]
MTHYLTLKNMVETCRQIKEKYIPDDSRFMKVTDLQFLEYKDANRDNS